MRLFLEARSIALIGATRRTGDGHNTIENLLKDGYTGKLYPVNPNADEISGVKAFHSIEELPLGIDLAVISTPRSQVPQQARQCIAKGIRALIIVAQGMADVGGEGASLQQELARVAREGGARVLGPNTFGVANAFLGLNTAFVHFEMYPIPVATIAQTGMLFGGTARRRLIGKAVDLGNTCDLNFTDALEYFAADPQIRVIVMYMEDVKDGRRFMEVARRAVLEKPVIVMKGGGTPVGGRLALSHTGSLAGRAEIYDAAFKQCGIIRAADFDEVDDLVVSFWHLPTPRGRRVAVITNTMGGGVVATDACFTYGLEMAELSSEAREKIARFEPGWLNVRNPVDVGPAGFVESDRQKVFIDTLEAVLADPGVDSVLFILPAHGKSGADFARTPELVQEAARGYPDKPVVGWLHSADTGGVTADDYMNARNVVIYPTPERAARALSRLIGYVEFVEEARKTADLDRAAVA